MSDSNLTKNALAASLKKLMRHRPFEKISVSDICRDCGINRKSFYYHFRDKYDLVDWIFDKEYMDQVDFSSYGSGWEFFLDLSRYLYQEKEFYRNALRIEGQNAFRDHLLEKCLPISQIYFRDILRHDEDDIFLLQFTSESFLTSLLTWLSGGYEKEMSPEEYNDEVKNIILRLANDLQKNQ